MKQDDLQMFLRKIHELASKGKTDTILEEVERTFAYATDDKLKREVQPVKNQKAELKVEAGELTMLVKIVDVKTSYGVKRYRVEPVSGTGSKWVSVHRLTIL